MKVRNFPHFHLFLYGAMNQNSAMSYEEVGDLEAEPGTADAETLLCDFLMEELYDLGAGCDEGGGELGECGELDEHIIRTLELYYH